jgi:hypothetical protein
MTLLSDLYSTTSGTTASNLGLGEGVYATKVGVDLQFKSLIGGDNITLTSDSNEVTISGSAGNGGTSGTSGSSGTSGEAGTSGSSGTSGDAGTSGSSGTSGEAGTSGSSGSSGTSGAAGTSGSSGSSGTSGVGGLSNIVEDITPQLGGDLEYYEHNQVFDITLTSDNTAAGDITTVTYGETVAFGQCVYPDSTDNKWKLALGVSASGTYPLMGAALEAKNDGESGKMLLRGTIRDATYFSTVTMGDIIYLSDTTAGSYMTTIASGTGDIVQIVGFAIASNYIFFSPDYTYVEIE